jgi:hypothetical protein
MKKLSFEQMETITGGSTTKVVGCAFASLGLLAAFISLATLTVASGGLAIAAAAAGFSIAPASWGLACFTDY